MSRGSESVCECVCVCVCVCVESPVKHHHVLPLPRQLVEVQLTIAHQGAPDERLGARVELQGEAGAPGLQADPQRGDGDAVESFERHLVTHHAQRVHGMALLLLLLLLLLHQQLASVALFT